MRRVVIASAVGALLVGMLLVIPSVRGKGGGANGTEVWWYEPHSELIKAVFWTTGSGIIHEWRYEPDDRALVFKPLAKFPEPGEGDYQLWTFDPSKYTIAPGSPGQLADFFTPGVQCWLQITMQD